MYPGKERSGRISLDNSDERRHSIAVLMWYPHAPSCPQDWWKILFPLGQRQNAPLANDFRGFGTHCQA